MASCFSVRELLGGGGFARVFLAHDSELDRLVAVKVPKTNLLHGDEGVKEFIKEARTAARLKHPGLVVVHDVQQPYAIMKATLTGRCRSKLCNAWGLFDMRLTPLPFFSGAGLATRS